MAVIIFPTASDMLKTMGLSDPNPEATAERRRLHLENLTQRALKGSQAVDEAAKEIIARYRRERDGL